MIESVLIWSKQDWSVPVSDELPGQSVRIFRSGITGKSLLMENIGRDWRNVNIGNTFDTCWQRVLSIGKRRDSLSVERLHVRLTSRAIDMERSRRAEIKRQQDLLVKAAMVNNVKVRRESSSLSLLSSTRNRDDGQDLWQAWWRIPPISLSFLSIRIRRRVVTITAEASNR